MYGLFRVHQSFKCCSASQCFTSVSQCFTSASQCFTSASQCFTSVSQCFTSASQCFTSVSQCWSSKCLQTKHYMCIYGRRPFMNHPIVGALTLVVVLVCSCVHNRSAMNWRGFRVGHERFRHAIGSSKSALHNCDMWTTVTCTQL